MSKVETEPYNEWMNLYNKDVEHIWHSQYSELRNAAMLLKVLDDEFKRLYKIVEKKFLSYEQNIRSMEDKDMSDRSLCDDKENTIFLDTSSPEVFLNNNTVNSSTLHSSNNVQDDRVIVISQNSNKNPTSPKINRFHRLSKRKKLKIDIVNNLPPDETQVTPRKGANDVIDSTIIEMTPEVSVGQKKVKRTDRASKLGKRKHHSNSTLTQMFSNISNKVNNDSTNSMRGVNGIEVVNPIKICVEEHKTVEAEKPKEDFVYKEPAVRGKARLKLEGWDCADCQAFYEQLDLNTQETKRLMNKCSRHRSKFKPLDYTPKRFWDLDFPPTQSPEKDTLKSTYFQY